MDYENLFEFIKECCIEYNIDESHGLIHSKRCIKWVEKLVVNDPTVSDDEIVMAIYAGALHDMCDKKYTCPIKSSNAISLWLLQQGWSINMTDSLIKIINSMSYTLLKNNMRDGNIIFPDHGKWQRVYNIVRHADLLDGYDVSRCFIFTKRIEPLISDKECWSIVKRLFDVRIFKYVSDGWIHLPLAIQYADMMHKLAEDTFLTMNVEYIEEFPTKINEI